MLHLKESLYPVGLIASLLFCFRAIYQWRLSEARKKSAVDIFFWKLSLVANSLLFLHGIIQVHLILAYVQLVNGIVALRNIQLLKGAKPLPRPLLWGIFFASFLGTFFLFYALSFVLPLRFPFVENPSVPFITTDENVSMLWHVLGSVGMLIFALRFWFLWFSVEKSGQSILRQNFWWQSLFGGLLAGAYFVRMSDPVGGISYGLPCLLYLRNLVLIRRGKK